MIYYLSCELVDAANQNQIWGNKYELTSDDISKVEDSIITSLMNPLQIPLINNPKAIQQNKAGKSRSLCRIPEGTIFELWLYT